MGGNLPVLTLERAATGWAPAVSPRSRAAAALVAKRVAAEDGIRFLSVAEVQALQARRDPRPVYVLDVRTREEYGAGHVAGAGWAPGGQAVQATAEDVAGRAGSILVVCAGFPRSTLAPARLRRMGFPP